MSIVESPFIFRLAGIFDYIEKKWESKSFLKALSFLLVGTYLLAILLIQLKHSGVIASGSNFQLFPLFLYHFDIQ